MRPYHPVKIAWNRFARTPVGTDLRAVLGWDEIQPFLAKVSSARNPAFRLSPDLFVEIPPPEWGRGDLLVYLPRQGWLVRRNYRDHWYVDMGIFRQAGPDLYSWTDLWLDVTTSEPAGRYRLLDADEFADALQAGQLTQEMAAYAMQNLHALVESLHAGAFPPVEVRAAEAFAAHRREQKRAAGER